MLEREAAAQAAARAARAEAASGDHASVGSIDAWETWESHAKAEPEGAAASTSNDDGSAAAAAASSRSSTATAVYAPSDPSAGTYTGGPGSIPHEVGERVHEVSTTGAAISLALLLQQRSELQEAASTASGGNGGGGSDSETSTATAQWVAVVAAEEEAKARHSSAALSALAYLEPCTHGLDEVRARGACRAVLRNAVLLRAATGLRRLVCACGRVLLLAALTARSSLSPHSTAPPPSCRS